MVYCGVLSGEKDVLLIHGMDVVNRERERGKRKRRVYVWKGIWKRKKEGPMWMVFEGCFTIHVMENGSLLWVGGNGLSVFRKHGEF